ncbi:MAG: hypothetical protein V1855_04075, partial [bacterium]
LELFSNIKHLLYEKGFTIAGAKKQLEEKTPLEIKKEDSPHFESKTQTIMAATRDQEMLIHETNQEKPAEKTVQNEELTKLLTTLKKDLLEFKNLLD